ncbi:phosphopantothenoylcysteine decarboxylase subunit VHS3-like [Chenopodium quinoa]|uniref:phosphopantothenoylcysteine decarboxylase subunit VHS3-like n=1 Tax=Chenopodium quinoa TaxID=63459 RepID=UPI000B7970B9|nr:phosphopantothenoylcysteine decarboxylase subunit VHS3-like [Chenopodium quinoa]
MNSHLDFLQQHTPNMDRNVEKGEPSSKRKRMDDNLNHHPKVIVVSSDSEISDSKTQTRELQPKRNAVGNNADNDDDIDLNDDDDDEDHDADDDSDDDGESDSDNENNNEDDQDSVQDSDTYKSKSCD